MQFVCLHPGVVFHQFLVSPASYPDLLLKHFKVNFTFLDLEDIAKNSGYQ